MSSTKYSSDAGRALRRSLRLCTLASLIIGASGAFAQKNAPTTEPAKSQALTLQSYLDQVTTKHEGLKAAQASAKGAKQEAEEASLVTSPSLTANASSSSDGQSNPIAGDDKFKMRNYTAGVGQQTSFGLSGKVAFNRIELTAPGAPAYNSSWVGLDLSQSLTRNWAGREVRAQRQATEAGALAKMHLQSHTTQQYLLEAESYYWRLALARERVQMAREAVDRAQRLYDWAHRRVNYNLADRTEILQATSNLQAQKLEQRSAEDDERAAAQAFNSSRSINSNIVSERLVDLTPELISSMNIPERTRQREDVQSAEFQAKAAHASAVLAAERNTPSVELYGTTPLTQPQINGATSPIAANVPASSKPLTTVGIRISAPLDFVAQNHARQGYNVEAAAADTNFQRRSFEAERDWVDLTSRFRQAKERLSLFRELETVQKTKLDYERDRHRIGRTTTQQVLQFESDYEKAQLGRLQTLAELLTLNAQMKLYGVSYESR
jgi:outer membrane protein TolC